MVKTTLSTLFIVLFSFQLAQGMDAIIPAAAVPAGPIWDIHSPNYKLFGAVSEGNLYEVKKLLKDRANPNAETPTGDPLLCIAALRADTRIVLALLRAGADIEDHNILGHTPLMLACINPTNPCVRILCKKGANPNTQDAFGRTALMYAAKVGNLHNLLYLRQYSRHDRKPDKNIVDGTGRKALYYAIQKGHGPVIQSFLR